MLLNIIKSAKWFVSLNIWETFHNIWMKESSEYLTAFKTLIDLYEMLVMPFELFNASETFQAWIDSILEEILYTECITFINDILIFEDTKKKVIQHIKKILKWLRAAKLTVKLKKCKFMTNIISFLDFILRKSQIIMNLQCIAFIMKWSWSQTLKHIQTFLSFVNFYHHFIQRYSWVVIDMINTLKKDIKFQWTEETEKSFQILKKTFMNVSVLQQFNFSK
jgi:hypothetical protein